MCRQSPPHPPLPQMLSNIVTLLLHMVLIDNVIFI